jgi:hypothetical protein
MAVGASAYLTKPISVRDFLHTLDTLLTQPVRAPAGAGAGAQAREAVLQPRAALQGEAAFKPETAQRDEVKRDDARPDRPWSG